MEDLFDLITRLVTNISQDDTIFDNFIEQINSTPLSEYRNENNYTRQQIENNEINENIIQNAYYIRRSFELNLEYQQQQLQQQQQRQQQRQRRTNIHLTSIFSNFFVNDTNDIDDVKITLSEKEFELLNTTLLDESKLKDCSICLDKLKLNDNLVILKCDHVYHKSCIKKWLCNQSTKCCVCRLDQRKT